MMFFKRFEGKRLFMVAAVLTLSLILTTCQSVLIFEQLHGGLSAVSLATVDLIGIWMDRVGAYTQSLEDGTFRAAESVAGLETLPLDWGGFQLQGTRLMLKNADDNLGCPGLTGSYQVALTDNGQLDLILLEDACRLRGTGLSGRPLERVAP
ncbi:MAG: hypothetical protein U9R25_13385 [Chloroflexota bacterium]|nr:hypothetical protein [Chloroflexota bacterium]